MWLSAALVDEVVMIFDVVAYPNNSNPIAARFLLCIPRVSLEINFTHVLIQIHNFLND